MKKNSLTDYEIDEVRHATRLVVRELGLLADTYQNIGVTLAERHLLLEVAASSCLKVGDIAARLLLEKSTMSRLIARAVKKGFIEYQIDPTDKRRRSLQLTKKGHQTLNMVEPLARKQVRDALDTLDAEEIHTLQLGIKAFAKGLSQARQHKVAP